MNPVLLVWSIPAVQAGTVEAAEHRRLSDEMHLAAARSLWSGVEERYQKVLQLEREGETLTVDDHWMGAQAARAVGDVVACRERLERAARAGGSKEVVAWLDDIATSYGPARVTVDENWTGDRALLPATPPFAPDARAAISFAGARLAEGRFDGLVPVGEYTVGGLPLSVRAGTEVAALAVRSERGSAGPYRLAYAGPRVSLGVAYTLAGQLSASGQSEVAGLQAGSFSGTGARLGLGLEVGFTPHLGAVAEVGYHNLFGPPRVDGAALAEGDTYLVAGNSLHLGYGWLAASVRFGNLWIAAGPVWGAGAATVTGVDGYCLESGTTDPGPCAEAFPSIRGDNASRQRLSGKITAGGGAASVSVGFVDVGPLRGAFSVNGGAQSDGFRWYPWGQFAFTVAPASRPAGGKG